MNTSASQIDLSGKAFPAVTAMSLMSAASNDCTAPLFNRRLQFMAERFDSRVALLLVSLSVADEPLSNQQSLHLKRPLMAAVTDILAGQEHALMMLDDCTLAVIIADINSSPQLNSLANKVVRSCNRWLQVLGDSLLIEARGGMATPMMPRVALSGLQSFARLALDRVEPFKVGCYPAPANF